MSEFIFSSQNNNIINPLEAEHNSPPDIGRRLAQAAVTLAKIMQIHEKANAGDKVDIALPRDLISPDTNAADLRTDISSLGVDGSPLALSVAENGDQLTASFQCVRSRRP